MGPKEDPHPLGPGLWADRPSISAIYPHASAMVDASAMIDTSAIDTPAPAAPKAVKGTRALVRYTYVPIRVARGCQ